jgi:hypothetical protein
LLTFFLRSHWAAPGLHTKAANQKKVAAGTAVIVGLGFALFTVIGLGTRGDAPVSLSKEWQAAQKKRHRDRQMAPISTHKVGAPVTVYEPSIVEGQD